MKSKLNPRQTIQKSIVLNFLRSVKTHPTAEMVYKAVKKKLPQISLGTEYRNLENFANKGIILKITAGNQARYDGDISDHGHFICQSCGKIDDIFNQLPKLNKIILLNGQINFI